MMSNINNFEKEILNEIQDIREPLTLSAEELAALCRLYVFLFMQSAFQETTDGETPLCENRRFRDSLCRLAEAICHRCEITNTPEELAFLCPALFELTRTGLSEYTEERLRFDTKLVESVLATHSCQPYTAASSENYRPLHAALLLLMQEPLTDLSFDRTAPGFRRYNFTLAPDLLRDTLTDWAKTQNPDGSWSGIPLREAFSRIYIIETDFGSVEGIDNKRISDAACEYYSTQSITSGEELALLYQTYSCRWLAEPDSIRLQHFVSKAQEMLSNPALSLTSRLSLQYTLLAAADN